MKIWRQLEETFQNAGIKYQQKDWVFLVEIESGKFYYSPQSGKWRMKRTRAWQSSNSVEGFIGLAKEYLKARIREDNNKKKSESKGKTHQKKQNKSHKSKSSSSKKRSKRRQSNQNKQQELRDEVRPEFLELFDKKIEVCNERNYKRAWIWKTLLDSYLLTKQEICWLCTIFDYAPGWAFHKAKEQHSSVSYKEILGLVEENRKDWLQYFNSRWQFSERNDGRKRQSERQQEDTRYNRSSTQADSQSQRYLDILRLRCPFSRQELKIAYRKKALETHPDMGGTTEAFIQVHLAFEVLEPLAC